MERQLPQPLALGDVKDVEAYVRAIVATLRLGERDEFEEYVADALELVVQRQKAIRPGQSLQRSLAGWLRWRLQDRRRERHQEWRRNARGATAYSLPTPTGLAWEHPGNEGEEPALAAHEEERLVQSRLQFAAFSDEAELRDPRRIGRFRGVPSWAALPTGTAHELWQLIKDERQTTSDTAATQLPPFTSRADVL